MAENFDFIVRLKDRFSKGFERLERATGRFIGKLGQITGITGAITAAFSAVAGARLFINATQQAATFEQQMLAVQAVTRASGEELALLTERARELGASTSFTAVEAAQGLELLSRAGLTVGEAIVSAGDALLLAESQSISLSEAADITAKTIRQFGLDAAESGRAVDVLALAASSTNQTVSDLASAFRQAAPLARQAGLSIEETAGLVGILADESFQGERGGTALRNALAQLSDPTSKFNRELSALGITSTNFIEVLTQLETRGDGARAAFAALGLESAPAISALATRGSEDLNGLIESLNGAEGAAQQAADTLNSGLSGALRQLNSAYQTAKEAFLDPLLAPLAAEVRAFGAQIQRFAESDAFTQLQQSVVTAFSTAATEVRTFLASLDFSAATDSIVSFADRSAQAVGNFLNGFRDASNVIAGTVDVLVAGFNTLRAAIEGTFGALALALQGAAQISDTTLTRLFGVTDQLTKLTEAAQFFSEISTRSFDAFSQSVDRATDAGRSFQERLSSLTEGAQQAAEDLSLSGEAASQYAEALSDADADLEAFRQRMDAASDSARDNANANREAKEAAQELGQSSETTAAQLDAYEQALSDLEAAGLGAGTEANNLRIEISFLERQLRETEPAVAQTSDAFASLGIQSQAALENIAEQSRAAFDQLVADFQRGDAAREDVVRGFQAYAEALLQTAENSDQQTQTIVENQLRQEAAALGVTDALETIGNAAEESAEKVVESASTGTQALQEQAAAAEQVAQELDNVGESAEQSTQSFSRVGTAAVSTGAALGLAGQQAAEFGRALAQGADSARAVLREVERQDAAFQQALEVGALNNAQIAEARDRNLEAAEAVALFNNNLGQTQALSNLGGPAVNQQSAVVNVNIENALGTPEELARELVRIIQRDLDLGS